MVSLKVLRTKRMTEVAIETSRLATSFETGDFVCSNEGDTLTVTAVRKTDGSNASHSSGEDATQGVGLTGIRSPMDVLPSRAIGCRGFGQIKK